MRPKPLASDQHRSRPTARDAVIIDTGGANLASLRFALQRLGQDVAVSRDPVRIGESSHLLLPGVGAAADTMRRLRRAGLDELIPQLHQPVLGICLGMQILSEASAEGPTGCLGILPGRVERLVAGNGLRVPHMGWNRLRHDGTGLCAGLAQDSRVYFLHSYAMRPGEYTRAITQYGAEFAAIVRRRNFYGTQFHPERSGTAGAQILANFLRLDNAAQDHSPQRAESTDRESAKLPCN